VRRFRGSVNRRQGGISVIHIFRTILFLKKKKYIYIIKCTLMHFSRKTKVY